MHPNGTNPALPQRFHVIKRIEAKGVVQLEPTAYVTVCRVIAGGTVSWRRDGVYRRERVDQGSLCVYPSFEAKDTLELDGDMLVSYLLLNAKMFEDALQDRKLRRLSLQVQENARDATLHQLTDVLVRESENNYESGPLFLQSLQEALAGYMVGRYTREGLLSLPARGGLSRGALRRCIEYIDANLERKISLERLANEADVSKSHLIRSFRESTGSTPHQYVLSRRIEYAKKRLQKQTALLTDVALSCGFNNQHHFSRVFRQIVGVTPSDYRLHHS